jgi:flagellar basal body P-ring formation protein FlgA
MRPSSGLTKRALIAGGVVLVVCGQAIADDVKILSVPAVTIYTGQVIRANMLVERSFAPNMQGAGSFADTAAVLVGQIARRTLLPGQPIPTNAIEGPKPVTRGAVVKVIVEDEGLTIISFGTSLESGNVGAIVRVRNLDTGVVITGIVQPDGSVRIDNG